MIKGEARVFRSNGHEPLIDYAGINNGVDSTVEHGSGGGDASL